jgi:hypothetical protein
MKTPAFHDDLRTSANGDKAADLVRFVWLRENTHFHLFTVVVRLRGNHGNLMKIVGGRR